MPLYIVIHYLSSSKLINPKLDMENASNLTCDENGDQIRGVVSMNKLDDNESK